MLTKVQIQLPAERVAQEQNRSVGQTVEFGIQVDLNQNPENIDGMLLSDLKGEQYAMRKDSSHSEKKKQKKKQYKKRKKQKVQQIKSKKYEDLGQARSQIGNIIQQFYERTAKFQDYSQILQELVEKVYNNDFREYLDQTIRLRVNDIQKSIWQYTQSILYENPFQRGDDHMFYSQMVDEIYNRYQQIDQSSRQIEKIINIYLKHVYHKDDVKEEIIYNNLAVNTFNYMIETDETLKNLIHICDKKISPSKESQRQKLSHLISIIEYYRDEDYEYQDEDYSNCPNDWSHSTCISEDEEIYEEKKKRRRKIKQTDLNSSEEMVLHRLENMIIKDYERVPCRVSDEWRQRIQLKVLKHRDKVCN